MIRGGNCAYGVNGPGNWESLLLINACRRQRMKDPDALSNVVKYGRYNRGNRPWEGFFRADYLLCRWQICHIALKCLLYVKQGLRILFVS